MTQFSCNLHYQGVRTWVHGSVDKILVPVAENDEGGEVAEMFVATSAMFEGYSTTAPWMITATEAFRKGLPAWLDEHPEQKPKKESLDA